MPFLADLDRAYRAPKPTGDRWALELENVKGEIGRDNVERITTQALLDILHAPQKGRHPQTFSRLAKIMQSLGWTPIRVRDLNRGGYKENVRGYARKVSR